MPCLGKPMTLTRVLRKTFQDWEREILRPVIASLLTATVVFVVALMNEQFRAFVFGSWIEDYPLVCRAEAFTTPAGTLGVDFFVINTSNSEYSRDGLVGFLRSQGLDTRSSGPDVRLTFWRDIGVIATAEEDHDFNLEKGRLRIIVSEDKRAATVVIEQIDAWAILKVILAIDGITSLPENRATDNAVPFTIDEYLNACYER